MLAKVKANNCELLDFVAESYDKMSLNFESNNFFRDIMMNMITKANTKKLVLSMAFIMGMGAVFSGCSKEEEHHEPTAVDKVHEAQELALANAPEPEIVELPTAAVTEDAGETSDATADATANTNADTAADTDTATASPETELEKQMPLKRQPLLVSLHQALLLRLIIINNTKQNIVLQ